MSPAEARARADRVAELFGEAADLDTDARAAFLRRRARRRRSRRDEGRLRRHRRSCAARGIERGAARRRLPRGWTANRLRHRRRRRRRARRERGRRLGPRLRWRRGRLGLRRGRKRDLGVAPRGALRDRRFDPAPSCRDQREAVTAVKRSVHGAPSPGHAQSSPVKVSCSEPLQASGPVKAPSRSAVMVHSPGVNAMPVKPPSGHVASAPANVGPDGPADHDRAVGHELEGVDEDAVEPGAAGVRDGRAGKHVGAVVRGPLRRRGSRSGRLHGAGRPRLRARRPSVDVERRSKPDVRPGAPRASAREGDLRVLLARRRARSPGDSVS